MSKSAIDALATQDITYRMEVIHPVSGLPMKGPDGATAWVELLSVNSEAAEAWKRQQFEAMQRHRNRRNAVESYDATQQKSAHLLAQLTVDWNLPVDIAGRPIDLPFSRERAEELYAHPRMSWLRKQVDEAIADDANFIDASART